MARLTLLTPASPEWRQLRPTRTSGNMMHLHWQRTRRMGARDPPPKCNAGISFRRHPSPRKFADIEK